MAFARAMKRQKQRLPKKMTLTDNGALSHATSGDARVDYFAKVLRDTPSETIKEHLAGSWELSPLDAMKLVAQKRDCRGGSGEKKVMYESMNWITAQHPNAAKAFINDGLVEHYGTWKDGYFCFCSTPVESTWIQHVATQLKADYKVLHQSDDEEVSVETKKKSISLCAKWVPSEGSSIDRKFHVFDQIVKELGLAGGNRGRQAFRTQYLAPLRQYLNLVEGLMCGQKWSEIKYEHVPSVAMNRLRKAFQKHDAERFQEYLSQVVKGEKKIKAGQLFPHDMVKHYMSYGSTEDIVINEQWKAYVEKTRELGQLERAVVLSDVSSSMSGVPMQVSIAMGLLISTVTRSPFTGQVITFSANPKFHQVDVKASLKEQVGQLQSAHWEGNTNFQAVFDLILARATEYKLKSEDMPTTLIVVSDMQFDQADGKGNFFTNHEKIKAKYRKAGYDMPTIVFWNVKGSTDDVPVTKEEYGTVLVSGFSPCHLKYLTTGKITTPYDMMRESIDSERYARVTAPADD